MIEAGFYNMDCMDAMRQFPDKFFDLAIVDPPYGSGGGTFANGERFGERFDRYRTNSAGGGYDISQTDCGKDRVHRTGGTWAAKFAKKLLRGT